MKTNNRHDAQLYSSAEFVSRLERFQRQVVCLAGLVEWSFEFLTQRWLWEIGSQAQSAQRPCKSTDETHMRLLREAVD
ncbi:hypothetical protein O181_012937 [Austropuccinia psidii MF-1]|uniref:Uncharacterized protein n=1 Tax=Austropuccinia psidii MF-1 TaxID=1389203 RepID=A0A9Q3BYN0_9BASI|nr:hypothetical protein [Austropuccinia psidii MF-1]